MSAAKPPSPVSIELPGPLSSARLKTPQAMKGVIRRTLFVLFFLSGFSSLICQVAWTRMAFASFGVITPVLSVVLSIFMLGLAVGSLAGGRLIDPLVGKTGISATFFYGVAEFLIGIGALAVPGLFVLSARLLLPTGEMNSLVYLLLSAIALAISIFPWCVCMGTTFPFMMAYVRELDPDHAKSFSFLYLANVLGAMAGTFSTAFVLVEILGFHRTLQVAAVGNFTIAVISVLLGFGQMRKPRQDFAQEPRALAPCPAGAVAPFIKLILFSTGFISMAMEVVWSRAFTVVLKTQVYSFAAIVFVYLGATFIGSFIYRRHLRRKRSESIGTLLLLLSMAVFLPVVLNDPLFVVQSAGYTFDLASIFIILASICPLCGLLGYLTPKLIDDYSAGEPSKAGEAYALNILGCILGPLVAAYLLLPFMSERASLIVLGSPLVGFWVSTVRWKPRVGQIIGGVATSALIVWTLFFSMDFEHLLMRWHPEAEIRRDYVASVDSYGIAREKKSLLVNGFGMTALSPPTKMMAHLSLALHGGASKSALVICFGMGTTYRSALSWNIDTTAVELVPSVVQAFGFYHADAARCLSDPHGHIVIDDGRRYLRRCGRTFDVIIVDPPPPVEAAGSSLLFSKEFYSLAKQHLNPGGIVQMWSPLDSGSVSEAIARSMYESFPHMVCYESITDFGFHLLGSMEPIGQISPAEMEARMPDSARADLMEWADTLDLKSYLTRLLTRRRLNVLIPDPATQILDDRPMNEYFLLRLLEERGALAR
jgi:predicted membrane-bound spermidine synthase